MTTFVVLQGVNVENFDSMLLRLKGQLGVQTDKEVAEVLGLSVKAFTARKMRGAFPVDKLLALKAAMPKLNVDYVLSGTAASLIAGDLKNAQTEISEYKKELSEVYGVRDFDGVPDYLPKPDAERSELIKSYFDQLDEEGKGVIESMMKALLTKK